jgi:hypothetical protein
MIRVNLQLEVERSVHNRQAGDSLPRGNNCVSMETPFSTG